MKTIQVKYYVCEICNHRYEHKIDAETCEAQPITRDKGVNVGDIVRVINGDGTGDLLKVSSRWIYDHYWGPTKYWHTVGISGELISGIYQGYSRSLAFTDYEVIK